MSVVIYAKAISILVVRLQPLGVQQWQRSKVLTLALKLE
jgi:hypothetical protein